MTVWVIALVFLAGTAAQAPIPPLQNFKFLKTLNIQPLPSNQPEILPKLLTLSFLAFGENIHEQLERVNNFTQKAFLWENEEILEVNEATPGFGFYQNRKSGSIGILKRSGDKFFFDGNIYSSSGEFFIEPTQNFYQLRNLLDDEEFTHIVYQRTDFTDINQYELDLSKLRNTVDQQQGNCKTALITNEKLTVFENLAYFVMAVQQINGLNKLPWKLVASELHVTNGGDASLDLMEWRLQERREFCVVLRFTDSGDDGKLQPNLRQAKPCSMTNVIWISTLNKIRSEVAYHLTPYIFTLLYNGPVFSSCLEKPTNPEPPLTTTPIKSPRLSESICSAIDATPCQISITSAQCKIVCSSENICSMLDVGIYDEDHMACAEGRGYCSTGKCILFSYFPIENSKKHKKKRHRKKRKKTSPNAATTCTRLPASSIAIVFLLACAIGIAALIVTLIFWSVARSLIQFERLRGNWPMPDDEQYVYLSANDEFRAPPSKELGATHEYPSKLKFSVTPEENFKVVEERDEVKHPMYVEVPLVKEVEEVEADKEATTVADEVSEKE